MTDRVETMCNLRRRCILRRATTAVLFVILLAGCGSKAVKDAQSFLDVKEYARAKELLELELKTSPKNEEAYLLLGKTELLLGDEDAAEKAFDTALLLDKDNKDAIAAAYVHAGRTIYEGIPAGEEVQPARVRAAAAYFERATTYDPDARAEISTWALAVAREQARTSRTTHPLVLIQHVITIDPDSRTAAARFAMQTAAEYASRNFTEEAAIYARHAATWDPTHLKSAARQLHAAALQLKDISLLRQALQWDQSLRDDAAAWLLVEQGASTPEEYLTIFPRGRHAAEARARIRERETRAITPEHERLVAAWPFDASTDDPVNDNDLHGSNYRFTSGVRNAALHLVAGGMAFPQAAELALLPGDFTLSLFVRSTHHGHLLVRGTSRVHQYGIGHTNARTPQGIAFTFNGGQYNAYSTTDVLDGTWHHVAAIKRGMTAELWIDGRREASIPITIDFDHQYGSWCLGCLPGAGDRFTGTVDELKMWQRALDPAEIRGEAQALRETTATITMTEAHPAVFARLLEDAPRRRLTQDELAPLTKEELALLRNSLYARHGRRFQNPQVQAFMNTMPWYRENTAYADGLLTTTDRQNIATISNAERAP